MYFPVLPPLLNPSNSEGLEIENTNAIGILFKNLDIEDDKNFIVQYARIIAL